jgi:hypothetical protein
MLNGRGLLFQLEAPERPGHWTSMTWADGLDLH